VTAPIEVAPRGSSISEEIFLEELAKRDPTWPAHIEAFLRQVEPLGVYPEFKASLNLKADIAGYDKPLNFGYITRAGKLWTDALSWFAGSEVARGYNQTLASLIGGMVATYPNGNVYLSTNGKSAPVIGDLLPHHAQGWAAAISHAISALQAKSAAEATSSSLPLASAGPGRTLQQPPDFDAAYRAGVPMAGIIDGMPRSPVMGFIRLPDGFAWCDDGICEQINPGNPLHPVAGEVVEQGSTIRCGHTELRPIDPDDCELMAYWRSALAKFGSVEAMHKRAEELLRRLISET